MNRRNSILILLAALGGYSYCIPSMAQDGTPLQDAVATVNSQMRRDFAEVEPMRPEPLPEEKWPAPLTVEEVIAAIRDFKPNSRGGEATFSIFQAIAKTKQLPPHAQLYHHDQWFDTDKEDAHEYRKFRYQIDVFVPEMKIGYGLPIRMETLQRRLALRPSDDHVWLLKPRSLGAVRPGAAVSAGDLSCYIDEGKEQSLVAFTIHSLNRTYELEAVAFDDEMQRHILDRIRVGQVDNTGMTRFELSNIPWNRVRYLGFQGVTEDGLRAISRKAVQEAHRQGISILPYPNVGSPYEFSLMTQSGHAFASSAVRGKVLVIDFWATWCGPCMKQMPELKKQYEKWHTKGLEVLGVSYDDNVAVAETAYKNLGIPWDLVVLPSDSKSRQLWTEATRISTLPTVLLVDQSGLLDSHLTGDQIEVELSDRIRGLLSDKQ